MLSEKSAINNFSQSVFFHFIGRLLYRTFVPMILLTNGYSLNTIFIYIISYSAVTVIFSLFAVKLLSHRNVLWFYILAIISEVFLILLLIPEKISYLILFLIILMEGIYYSYYYISYYSILAHYSSTKKTSNNLGNLGIVSGFSNIFAPLIGALLLMINKNLFIIVAILFLVLSIIPLLKITKTDINGKNLKKIRIKDIKSELFSCGIRSGIEFIVFILWALFVFVSGYSLIYIGMIPAIEALANIILLYTIKQRLISIKFRSITKIVSIFGVIFISFYRYLFPEQMILTNFLIALFFTSFSLCVNSDYFEKVKHHQTYNSAAILDIITFSVWIILATLTYLIGLKLMILIPIVLSIIWIVFNIKKVVDDLS